MGRRYYTNGDGGTTLSAPITNSATTLTVAAATTFPASTPFTATIDYGTANAEVVLVTNVAGTTLTVTRGYDGTTGVSHAASATIQSTLVAEDADEANAHVNATSAVHGVAGALVGTTDAQTLTNKTLSAPTVSGTVAGNPTFSGNVTITGTLNYVPTGAVNMFAGSSAPSGFLLCDGSAVSRTTYAALFAVCSTAYGAGDGSTTFNLPNFKGSVAAGYDVSQTEFNALGKTGGEKTHTLTAAEMPTHSHAAGTLTALRSDAGGANNIAGRASSVNNQSGVSSDIAIAGSTANAGSGGAHNNLQPYVTVNYIIKT